MHRGPWYRHIVTCIPCGFREATKAGGSYAERCPGCGGRLERFEIEIDDRDELETIDRQPRHRRIAA